MFLVSIPVLITGLFFFLEKRLTKPWMRWGWWLGSGLFVGLLAWNAGRDINWFDFKDAYYAAGRAALTDITQLYSAELFVFGFVNIPLLAYLFAPFGLFPLRIAGLAYYAIGYVSLIPITYFLLKLANLNGWRRWVLFIALIVNDTLEYSLDIGNNTHFILLGVLVALWLFERERPWLAGILLGFSGLNKLPLILPSGYFFIRRQWSVVAGGLLVVAISVGLSFLFIPVAVNLEWFDKLVSFTGHPTVAYNNQSLAGFLGRLLMPESDVYSWNPIEPSPAFKTISKILTGLFYLPMLTVLFIDWRSPRTKPEHILEFMIVFACSLLTSSVSWTHYYSLFLIPIALYLKDILLESRRFLLNGLFGVGLILISVPNSLIFKLFERTDQRIFLSIHFLGGVLIYLFLLVLWFWKRYGQLRESAYSNHLDQTSQNK